MANYLITHPATITLVETAIRTSATTLAAADVTRFNNDVAARLAKAIEVLGSDPESADYEEALATATKIPDPDRNGASAALLALIPGEPLPARSVEQFYQQLIQGRV
jgi:hypothetical protein